MIVKLSPQRIVCLTEETTEWLYMLGEESRIVGISSFTVRPHRAREEKPKVCAFLSAKIVKILALQAKAVFGFPIGQPIPQPYPRAKAASLLTHPA